MRGVFDSSRAHRLREARRAVEVRGQTFSPAEGSVDFGDDGERHADGVFDFAISSEFIFDRVCDEVSVSHDPPGERSGVQRDSTTTSGG